MQGKQRLQEQEGNRGKNENRCRSCCKGCRGRGAVGVRVAERSVVLAKAKLGSKKGSMGRREKGDSRDSRGSRGSRGSKGNRGKSCSRGKVCSRGKNRQQVQNRTAISGG